MSDARVRGRRRPLADERTARRRRRFVDPEHQGRGPRPRHRCGGGRGVGAAHTDHAAAVGAGPARRGGRRSRRRGRPPVHPQSKPSASPVSSTGWSCSTQARDVIRPAKLWNDTETAPDAGWLMKQLPGGAADWAAAVGSVPVAAFTVTKLSWLHRSEPDNWARLAHVVLPHDWMTFRLTGELVTDRGDASGTGYWSPPSGEYRWDILAHRRQRPRLVDGGAARRGAAEVVGEWNGAKVALRHRRQHGRRARPRAAARRRRALARHLRHGVRGRASSPTADRQRAQWPVSPTPPGGILPLACTLNATKVTDAIARLLGVDHDEFDRLALARAGGRRRRDAAALLRRRAHAEPARSPPGCWPAFAATCPASSSPAPRSRGSSAACSTLSTRSAAQTPLTAVRLVGGGARSAAYRQVVAELCDLPSSLADADEAVATGACVQAAAVALGIAHAEVAERWGARRRDSAAGVDRRCRPACGLATPNCARRPIPRPHDH